MAVGRSGGRVELVVDDSGRARPGPPGSGVVEAFQGARKGICRRRANEGIRRSVTGWLFVASGGQAAFAGFRSAASAGGTRP